MKSLFKIFVIILSALLIVGAAYTIRQTGWGSSLLSHLQGGRPEGTEMFMDGERPASPPGDFDRADFDRASADSLHLESFLGFTKTLIPITLLILVINTLPTLVRTRQRRFQRIPG